MSEKWLRGNIFLAFTLTRSFVTAKTTYICILDFQVILKKCNWIEILKRNVKYIDVLILEMKQTLRMILDCYWRVNMICFVDSKVINEKHGCVTEAWYFTQKFKWMH